MKLTSDSNRRFAATATATLCVAFAGISHSVKADSFTWTNGASDSAWNTSDLNWNDTTTSANGVAWGNGNADVATFDSNFANAGTVNVGTGITFGGLNFNNGGWTIASGTLTTGQATTINNTGANTISSVLAGSNAITVNGAVGSNLTLSGSNTAFSGGLTVNSGTVTLAYDVGSSGTAGAQGTGPLTINSGATVQDSGAFTIAGSAYAGTINIDGGTLIASHAEYFKTINMTGGTLILSQTSTDYFRPESTASFNTLASSTTALITSTTAHGFGNDIGGLNFNVAKGTTTSGVDLIVNANIGNGYGNVSKSGAGTLLFTGTYSAQFSTGGNLLINAGTWQMGTANGFTTVGSGAYGLKMTGGTFATGGFNQTFVNGFTLAGTATIDMGNAGILKFGNSSAIIWTGTLSIANWNGSTSGGGTSQLFFGTSADLTSGQLADIQFLIGGNNVSAIQLADGEVVAVPEPSTVALAFIFGAGMLMLFRRCRAATE